MLPDNEVTLAALSSTNLYKKKKVNKELYDMTARTKKAFLRTNPIIASIGADLHLCNIHRARPNVIPNFKGSFIEIVIHQTSQRPSPTQISSAIFQSWPHPLND